MKKFNKSLMTGLVTAGLVASFGANATNGYFSHGYGVKSKGMAGAGAAYAQDAMAAATNPAGVATMNDRIDFGAELFMPDRTANVFGVARDGNESDMFLVPEFGYTSKIDDVSSWGVVVYGNGGMNTDYKTGIYSSNPAGLNDKTPTGVNLAQLFIAPTYARKLDDKNSIGVSLNLIYQTFEATGLSNFIAFKENGATGRQGLTDQGEDSSTGYSLKLGWTGEMTDQLTVAFTYQMESEMSKFDKYKDLFANDGEFNIPAHYTLGFLYKATPKMNVAFDIQQINYSDIPAIANKNCGFSEAPGVPGPCDLGDPGGPGFGWDDMTVFKLGFDYQVSDDLVVRAGFSHGEHPIPATETAFNVIAPAVVEDHLTLGATWTMANKAELSAFYMHALENEVKGSSPGNTNNAGHGDIKMSQNSLGIAYGWKF